MGFSGGAASIGSVAIENSSDDSAKQRCAFEAAYRRHAAAVYRVALLRTSNPAVAEDVAAETWAAALRAFAGAPGADAALRSWLMRIAANKAADHGRRAARRLRLERVLGRQRDHTEGVVEAAERREELREVLEALARAPERERTLVALRIGGELSFEEVAAVTGMSAGAAQMATARALQQLRRRIAETRGDG